MRTVLVVGAVAAALAASPLAAAEAETFARGLTRLKSSDAFDRERGEVEIRNLGVEALHLLAPHVEAADRLFRFRAERIFSDLVDTLLADLDGERQFIVLDETQLG